MGDITHWQAGSRAGALLALIFIQLAGLAAAGTAAAKEIEVAIDEAALVRLDRQAADVIVGNPSIADVSVQNGRTLVVTGKSFGVTNLIVVDGKGKQILSENVAVGINNRSYVTLMKGRNRSSYHCSPTCQIALIPGDAADHFEGVSKELRNKFGIAQSALDDSAQAPQ